MKHILHPTQGNNVRYIHSYDDFPRKNYFRCRVAAPILIFDSVTLVFQMYWTILD